MRWYARYIETLLSTSRVLGYFLGSTSCSTGRDQQEERISTFSSQDLVRDVDSLVGMIEEICKVPDPRFVEGSKLLYEVISLLSNDYLSTVNAVLSRLSEFNVRMSCLSFAESVELACALKRLEDCKEKLSLLFPVKKPSAENLWGLVSELKEKTGKLKAYKEERKLLTWGKCDQGSESARFVMKRHDSVQFSSGRLGGNKLALLVVESGEPTIL